MSSSEEYTDDYGKIDLRITEQRTNGATGKIEDFDITDEHYRGCPEVYSHRPIANIKNKMINEMKCMENVYLIKCLISSVSDQNSLTTEIIFIDNYGNYYRFSFGSGFNSNIDVLKKNIQYKLSNKLIDLIKCLTITKYYSNGCQQINEFKNINNVCDKIKILAEDNYKKYMEINMLKAKNNILKEQDNKQPELINQLLEKTKELKDNEQKERIDQQNELISKLMDEIYDLKNKN